MVLALAVALVGAFVMPVAALENEFGGYWRTRAVTQQNFTGEDQTEARDNSFVDTRTRLYYTAKINSDLKFVNKFEFNTLWGDTVGGDIGADGMGNFRIKHSYADFTLAPVNFKVGMQEATVGRGFMFSDDFAGLAVTFKGEGFAVPFIWMKVYEGMRGYDANKGDFDFYALAPSFSANEMIKISPFFLWATSDNASKWKPTLHAPNNSSAATAAQNNMLADELDTRITTTTPSIEANNPDVVTKSSTAPSAALGAFEKVNVYYLGLDIDAKFDMGNVWFTGIYQLGKGDLLKATKNYTSVDFQAYLAAVGGKADMGMADIHGQFLYASGDDAKDEKIEAFFVPSQNDGTGQSYFWAEILGYGIFDTDGVGGWAYNTSTNSPGDKISNIMAINLGTTYKPMKELSVTLDVWYAKLAKGIPMDVAGKDAKGNTIYNYEDCLGTEVDLVLTYELVKGLKMDLVGAYLFAGDATYKGNNNANPYEIGTRLSLSF